MSVFWIGLTGGVASGKTTVAQLFLQHRIDIVDADMIAAELTQDNGPTLPTLRQALGQWAFTDDGRFDRVAVRQRIFASECWRQRLEDVLHPLIRQAIQQRLADATSPYAIGVVPLLFERPGWRDLFQRIAVVDCQPALQQQRAKQRDECEDAVAIMATQWSNHQRLDLADDKIDNNGDQAALVATVASMHEQYLQFAKTFTD